ncbi:MAG: peptide-methionine (R)-S-oxide reductase MsrB [Burkholderiales bacterium]
MSTRRDALRNFGVLAGTLGSVGALHAKPAVGGAGQTCEIPRNEAEWKKQLSPDQFTVLRTEGTERAHTSPLDLEERPGTYVCAGCALPVFSSQHKFISPTGWPSFWQPLPGGVREKKYISKNDGQRYTEIGCRRCKSHLGHVYNDGPQPTGLRYCINGLALALAYRPLL